MKRTIRLSERELHRVIKESVRRLISEDTNPEYDGYVLIDEASEEVIQNYSFDELQDAINDAKSMGRGRFLVVGCRGNEYDLNDVVFDSNPDSSYKFENIVRKAVKESVRRIVNEIGDTRRGQYMLGRVDARATDKHIASIEAGDEDVAARQNKYNASDSWARPLRPDGKNDYDNDPYIKGMDDQRLGDRKRIQNQYDVYKMQDTDQLKNEFINFVEKNGLETVYDYESGNMGQGQPVSPAPALIQMFMENLGYDLSPESKQALKNAYNQWWYYASSQFDFGD